MKSILKWHQRFLQLANFIANWSKDSSTQVGAVIVNHDKRILSVGYNGFPQGVRDDIDERNERPNKYLFTEHAERNAIYNALKAGANVNNSTIYCNYLPCPDCTRAIIQSGVKQVIYQHEDVNSGKNSESKEASKAMFNEAKVLVRKIDL